LFEVLHNAAVQTGHQARLAELSAEPMIDTPERFAAFCRAEAEHYASISPRTEEDVRRWTLKANDKIARRDCGDQARDFGVGIFSIRCFDVRGEAVCPTCGARGIGGR
jgi:hypothetical protein